jgi:hypothetical protein
LTDEEQKFFREFPQSDPADPKSAVRRAVVLILSSPHFLYPDLTAAGEVTDQHTIATRLALTLWDSIPDAMLFEAAENGQLGTPEQIAAHAHRMLDDARTRAKMRGFFHQWLELEGPRDLSKDEHLFPEFDAMVIADLRYSLDTFFEQVFWSDLSDYRELLLADYLLLNERLRAIYQIELPETDDAGETESEFERVAFSAEQRAGVLTHPYLLSALAYHNSSSPIHRGVFLTRNIVGRRLKPPPAAVAFNDDEFAPDLTMREKITQLTRNTACMSCHSVINPLGFALENYDAIGRWRTSEHEKPIETWVQYQSLRGETLEIDSARDIANLAVQSESAHRAFVRQLFHHLVKQDTAVYGPKTIDQLTTQFAADGFHMQRLIERIALLTAVAATSIQPPGLSVSHPSSDPNSNSDSNAIRCNQRHVDSGLFDVIFT